MHFLILGIKRPGADQIRTDNRIAHLRYMMAHRAHVVIGGSVHADDGSWGGMTVVVDLPGVESVRAWVSQEPYASSGLFESVTVWPFRLLMPEPEEGLLERELTAELDARRVREAAVATKGLGHGPLDLTPRPGPS